ncbi:MAG TPA: CDP-alcohol phosphatidyltransferase family protein [Gaiellaceae bacterium]|nr:CDP-alcohol phosphatidyltransferase family protein [Gaiellaceae bacterium]
MSSALARSRKARLAQEQLCEWVYRPLAHVVVLALLPLRVPPPAVVLAATGTGLVGAVELARGHFVAAALLVQLKTVLDNADGQLARLSGKVTAFGRYLDSECDLVVNAALFAALGWATTSPVAALAGFVALTAVLTVNFNVERLARGGKTDISDSGVLAQVYRVMYGWQDRLVERFVAPDRAVVVALAQLGMSGQLAAFGLFVGLGHPLYEVWFVLAQLPLVGMLVLRPRLLQEEIA